MKPVNTKQALHPRNQHRERYDFNALMKASAELVPHVQRSQYGDASIDFSNPQAVMRLNQALLKQHYHVAVWDIPKHYLCPPIPGRADYIHYLADLLAETNGGVIPQGSGVRILDIGTGANVIYPLVGQHEYGWQFLGADIDEVALNHAQKIVDANALTEVITLRRQTNPTAIFKGLIKQGETFSLTMCNPPFHSSIEEAQAGSKRKWRGLSGKKNPSKKNMQSAVLNFGGQNNELYCEGGERTFVLSMIKESKQFAAQCQWFTTLISKATTLPSVYRALKKVGAKEVKTISMQQGQKQSRIVVWTFFVK